MNNSLCSKCGKKMDDFTFIKKARKIFFDQLRDMNIYIIGEYMNPGGRELKFNNGIRIQLCDYCGWCDLEKIKTYFKEVKND